ncbi:hypothetical protein E2562_008897 [Oryza meyeriana var. granulata]|uniref:Uncharacterized protein n=1 Tax=Oryza meyeriana var. granulata TaxID=110450 RepID=A0A6G1D0I5_9ORYZ|nr:hypothetical protein E2562_008897 [Oryza meyeriana var. granulata]
MDKLTSHKTIMPSPSPGQAQHLQTSSRAEERASGDGLDRGHLLCRVVSHYKSDEGGQDLIPGLGAKA